MRADLGSKETIFALATAKGRAGVAVFRISGPEAGPALAILCRLQAPPDARVATLAKIHHPSTGEVVDRALVLFFKAPHSFTGEDVAEIQAHGGRAMTDALAEILSMLPGLRLAEPGEFTRRGFENGKMDLTEAEAIADLVDAETEAQRRQALRQLEGSLGQLYEGWRTKMAQSLAYLEASIDFSDEELPHDIAERQLNKLHALGEEMAEHLDDGRRGERLRDGFSIAILGPPNAGKSSLLNKLAQREAAIVSSVPGTTRDIIDVHLDLGGYPIVLADTAGLRESADAIENEGVKRALKKAERADLKLLVFDGAVWPERDAATEKLLDGDVIVVINKADLVDFRSLGDATMEPLFISTKTGEGVPELLKRLIHEVDLRFAATGTPVLTRARHRAALEECIAHLLRAVQAGAIELRAEDVRLAMRALGRITGRVDVEDLLDIIFRDFCIGK